MSEEQQISPVKAVRHASHILKLLEIFTYTWHSSIIILKAQTSVAIPDQSIDRQKT